MTRCSNRNIRNFKWKLTLLWHIYTKTVTIYFWKCINKAQSFYQSCLIIYIHGIKRIRSPTSYSANREFFEARCTLHKSCARSKPRPCVYGVFFAPRIQVHKTPSGRYLCPSGLSKVRTRLLPLNERKRFIRVRLAYKLRCSYAGLAFTWIP